MNVQQSFVDNLLKEITVLVNRAIVAETLLEAEKEKVSNLEAQLNSTEKAEEDVSDSETP